MGMDREQFYRGWLMLVAQPWGRAYQDRGNLTSEQRTTAQIQQELYFKRLSFCNPYLWESIAEWFSTGDHWPSLDELKRAIQANSPIDKQAQLIEPDWSNAPEPLALVMAHHKRELCSLRDAAIAVIPGWIKNNPGHIDRSDAQAFLESARGNFGVTPRKAVQL
ncbi:MAG: hypothetical protein OEY86_17585 [Nitrospira sp.]|nr:hypothetical protein [Nitrospira sp.]